MAKRAIELLYDFRFGRIGPRNRTFLGHRRPRRCCFCGGQSPETAFSKRAHVIPVALGNRALLSYEECDDCNLSVGGPLENDLCNALTGVRILGRMPSRKGSTKYRPAGSEGFAMSAPQVNAVKVIQDRQDDRVKFEDLGDNRLVLKLELPPFSPANVGRSLARMAFFVVKDSVRERYSHLLPWIRRDHSWLPFRYHRIFIPGGGDTQSGLVVAEHQDPKLDGPLLVLLAYPFTALLIELPGRDWKQREEPDLNADLLRWSGPDRLQVVTATVQEEGNLTGVVETYNPTYEEHTTSETSLVDQAMEDLKKSGSTDS